MNTLEKDLKIPFGAGFEGVMQVGNYTYCRVIGVYKNIVEFNLFEYVQTEERGVKTFKEPFESLQEFVKYAKEMARLKEAF